MIIFDELRITDDNQYLIIDLHIKSEIVENHSEAYIKNVWICDSSNYEEGGVPTKVDNVYTRDGVKETTLYKKVNVFECDYIEGTFKDKLIFVYVEVAGVDESQLSCGCNKNPSIGATIDMHLIYNQFMKYINELSNKSRCDNTPKGLIDFILRYNGFLLAIDSGHYKKGVEFYNKWFNKDSNVNTISNCGCNN